MRARAGFIHCLLAAAVLLFAGSVPNAFAQTAPEYRPGEVLVKFRPSGKASAVLTAELVPGSDLVESFPKLGIERLRLRSGTVEEAVARLREDPAVEFAEPNYVYKASLTPNDPGFSQLWGLLNTGQTGGTPGADIHAPQAWNTFTGSSSVLVGVIDTGADYTHPDLAANMFINPGEIPGNGMDDDSNGFIDDVHGWDFANHDNDPMDDHYHGTHVSGTIGAVGDNGIGVAGVNWNVKILPIKFLDSGGSGSTDEAIHSIEYAALMHVKVINASWGGGGYSEALKLAIQAAGDAGVLFVAAAGNGSSNTDIYPNYPSAYDLDCIVAVAATDHNDQLAYFSNYGVETVDLAAPGVNTYSTLPGNNYGQLSGTSMATPHVVGVAALIRGRFPAATVAMTKALLLERAQPLPNLAGVVKTGARLDALMSLSDPDTIPPAPVVDLTASDPGGEHVTLHWTATGDDGATGSAFAWDVRYSTAPIDSGNFAAATPALGEPQPLPAGSAQQMVVHGLAFSTGYYFALRALDEFGNSSDVSNDAVATTLGPPDIAILPDTLSESLLTGATSTQHLTVSNSGVSDLEFTIRREGDSAGLAIDVIAGSDGLPQTVLATGHPVPITSLVGASQPISRTVQVGNAGPPDRFGVIRPGSITPGPVTHAPNEEVFGSTQNIFAGNPRSRGNIFQCTTSRTLHEHRLFLSPYSPTQLWFLVYEGTSATGNYTLVSASNVSPAGPGMGWYSSGVIDLPLTEGHFYLVIGSFDQYGEYYNQVGISPYPMPASFGSLIGPAGWNWAPTSNFPPDPVQNIPPEAFGDQVAYYQTLVTDDRFTWVSAYPETATVAPGGQLDVAVNFDAAGMNDGDYNARLVFESNDPDESAERVGVHLHVTGAADIAVVPDSLDFGPLFIGGTLTDSVEVRNPGTATLNISAVTAAPGDYSVASAGFSLAPGAKKKLAVHFSPTAAVAIPGTLTIASDDPDEPVISVLLSGVGLIAPDIAVSPDSLSASLLTDEQTTRTVTIENTGGSNLDWTVRILGDVPLTAARIVVTPPEPGPGDGGGHGTPAARSDQVPAGYKLVEPVRVMSPGAHVLLIQDYLPWGSSANNQVLAASGILYDQINSYQLAGTNLANYQLLIVAGDQAYSTYSNLAARKSQIDDFVQNGGSLEFHAAGFGYAGGDPSFVTLPGGMHNSFYYSELNHVLLTNHPIVEGVPNPFTGTGASHSWFYDLPLGAKVIATDDLGRPDLVEYSYGSGHVVAAAQTVEYAYSRGQAAGTILTNLIPYMLHGGASWLNAEPIAGTVPPGGSATLTVTFDATGLFGGDYRGAVRVESNDPNESEVDVVALLHVTGVPRIALLGHEHEVASTGYYYSQNSGTHHLLALPSVPGVAGSIRLTTEGDFNDIGETATLVVEGVTIGHVGERGYECAPDSASFDLTDAQLQQFGADKAVAITVVNSPTVEAYCYYNRHTVRLRYRDPGDAMAFGLRLIGECRSETLEVSNPGTDTLIVTGITSSSGLFVPSQGAFHVGPRSSVLLGVTFCPVATGPVAGTLTLHSNDPDAALVTVALSGAGAIAPDIAITPGSLSVELLSNQTTTRTLTIANTGGPLVWSAFSAAPDTTAPDTATVVTASPVFQSAPGDALAKGAPRPAVVRDGAHVYTSAAAPGSVVASPVPVPGPAPTINSLENVLASLDAHFDMVTAAIPNRYDFSEGVIGYQIVDGGNDMYDGGNILGTNYYSYLPYSDGVIRNEPAFGPTGRYFTRKYPGLFVLAADCDNVNAFVIQGYLGADGLGSVDAAELNVAVGGGYRGFVKRVFGAGDPSVNHLVIAPGATHAANLFSTYTYDDYHVVTGLDGKRLYYLVYAGSNGSYIDNAATGHILSAFLAASRANGGAIAVSPATGGVPGGGSVQLEVKFDSEGLFGGDYDGQVVVKSNDPDESPFVVPTHMHVIGVPDIALAPDTLDFGGLFLGASRTDTVVVRNTGTTQLNVSSVSAGPAPYSVAPASFSLPPGGQYTLTIGFTPTSVGQVPGSLQVSSDDPDEPVAAITLLGEGLIPPDIAVAPDSLGADVPINEQRTRTLTISNTGGSALTYAISFSGSLPGDSARVAPVLARANPPTTDATANTAQPPIGYHPIPSLAAKTLGAQVLLVQDYLPWGSTANNQLLTAHGIPFDIVPASQLGSTDLGAYRAIIVASDQPWFTYQAIAAVSGSLATFVAGGGVLEFHGAGWGWNGGDPSGITLPGGAHMQFLNSYTNYVLNPSHPLVAGVPNPFYGTGASHSHPTGVPGGATNIVRDESGLPNLVTYRHGAGLVIIAGQTLEYGYDRGEAAGTILRNLIPFTATGGVNWLSAQPRTGTVPAGGSVAVTVMFDAGGLLGGDYHAELHVDSNDPDENPVVVPVGMRAIGVPNIVVTPGAIDFGPVFIGASLRDTVSVQNTGTGPLTVSDIVVSPAAFFAADTVGFVVAPGAQHKVAVYFAPTALGPTYGSIGFVSDDPDAGVASALLAGTGLVPPNVVVTPESLSASLAGGAQTTRTLTVANTGGSPLAYQVWIAGDSTPPDSAGGPLPEAFRARTSDDSRSDHPPADFRPAAVHPSTMAGARVLLIQDTAPWGSEANNSILDANGIPYDQIGSAQIAGTNLSAYRDVILAGDQPTTTYQVFAARAAQIDAFVTNGGTLEFHAAGWGFAGGNPTGITLPGGMHIVNSYSGMNTVLLPGHPLVAGVPNPFYGTLASHAGFTNIPQAADLIVSDEQGYPNLVRYRHGFGRVVASGQTLERGFSYGESAGKILRNMIPYDAQGGAAWLGAQPISGTVPVGGNAVITVTFDATGLTGGEYLAGVEIDSNDPDEPVVLVPAHLTVLGAAGLVSVAEHTARFELAAVVPTPARGTAGIEFELTRPGNARVTIYDVAGRQVRTLASGEHTAGRHRLAWRGEDDRGVRRGAGVYLLKLDTSEGQRTRRLVWVP